MKNKFKERQKITQRLAGKGRSKGVYLPHCYDNKKETDLTWWDDMYFWLNGIRYTITFVHPRMRYKDTCDEIVWDKLYPSRPDSETKWNVYKTKKLGKSRKKAVLFTMEDTNEEAISAWHKQLWEEEAKYVKESDVVVKPSVRVVSWNHAKNIDICIPYEILCKQQALFVVEMIKEHYRAGTLYEWVDKMKAVKYDKDSWNKEHPETSKV